MSKIKYELINNKEFLDLVENAMNEFYIYISEKFKKEKIYMFSFGMAPRVMGDPYDCILYVNTEEYYEKKIKQYPKDSKEYYRYCAQEWTYMGYSDGFDKVSAFLTDYFGDMDFYDELEEDLYSAFAEGFSKLIKEGKLINKNGEQLFLTFCCDECFISKNIYINLVKKLNDDNLERQKYLNYIKENYD